jgi:hypothetical protein
MFSRRSLALAATAVIVSGAALPAAAAETIKLVAIDGYPAKAMWVDQFSNFFIPEVNKRQAETGNY